ncbi:MAG: hypothetical protein IJO44_06920 [Clostridia bacterium]|nr:hypothetical protein [Clostridia bacterium]
MKSKKWIYIILIVVVCVIGYNVINDDSSSSGNSGIQDTINNNDLYQQDDDLDYNNNSLGDSSIPYTYSRSGYLIDNYLEPITYSVNDVNTLSGIFVLDQANTNLVSVPSVEYDAFYESTDQHLFKGSHLPVCLDRSKGDSLVIVGGEWEGRSRNDKDSMTIDLYNVTVLGYGNMYMFEDLDVDEMDSVNGISIASVNKDSLQVTQALIGAGITCVYENWNQDFLSHKYLLSTQYNSTVDCGFYEGTQYKNMSVNMSHPFVLCDENNPIQLSVQTTPNGYFVIDVSTVPAGLYAIDLLMGAGLIVIE